jgi:holo-[acyl-carrier protein] synthase
VSVVGIGIDAVEIDRMARALDRTPTLLGRLFTEGEQAACAGRAGSLAARFAAKEAVAKAFGTGIREFAFRDVEIVNDDLGKPEAVLHAGAAALAARLGVTRVHVSLTTSRELAVANAVIERAE